jgi:hypothetical protein
VEPDAETKARYQEILARRPASPLKAEGASPGAAPAPPPQARSAAPRGHEPPLVGREPELTHLRRALDLTRAKQGLVVAITGEAGVGKSRLAAELVTEVEQRGGSILTGRCYETEQILPFSVWVDVLRTVPATAMGQALDGLRPAWRMELGRLLPELSADPPGPDATPGALRLFEAVAQLPPRLATARPLLVLLEDLHWADEATPRPSSACSPGPNRTTRSSSWSSRRGRGDRVHPRPRPRRGPT